MTTSIPTPATPEPERDPEGRIDWDLLNTQVFGDTADAVTATPAEKASASLAVQDVPAEAPVASADDEEPEQAAMVPLSTGMKWVIAYVAIAVGVLAVLGFVVSFDTQTRAVEPYFGVYAPLVPLAIDLGIVVFAALNLVLARLNMSLLWLRAVPWVLTAMSLYINLSAHHELVARIAHVALPGMWIVASEVGTHILRIRAGLEAGTRTESLGIARWLLSPVTTLRLWRHMRLWGVKTAAKAREVESQRLEAKAALRYRYRAFWRVSAPIQLLTAYRLCKLTAEEVYTWTPPRIVTAEECRSTEVEDHTLNEGVTQDSSEAHTSCTFRDSGASDTKQQLAAVSVPVAETTGPGPETPVKRTRSAPGKQSKPSRPGAGRVSDETLLAEIRRITQTEGAAPSSKRVRREFGVGSDRAARLIQQAAESTD